MAPPSDRPPVDKAVNEIFFDKKCGILGTEKLFFGNCMSPSDNEITGIKCEEFRGQSGACDMKIAFTFDNYRSSENTTPIAIPTGFRYDYSCYFGSQESKPPQILAGNVRVPRETMLEVMEFCRQELYGPPSALPLWLILLIIFLVIAAVSVSAYLFWHYWLRKVKRPLVTQVTRSTSRRTRNDPQTRGA